MRLYGIIQAFRKGRMPDNQQIDETLCWIRDHSPIDENKLSGDGRRLIHDVREIIETVRVYCLYFGVLFFLTSLCPGPLDCQRQEQR